MIAARIIYFFTDTNLFIQCRALEELDWSAWEDFDEVHLIVSRPVQQEIDNQKNRGKDRIGNHARKTHSLFSEIITGEQGSKLIRDSNPQVRLLIESPCQPSPELDGRLNYQKPDDALVGCLHAYLNQNPDKDVRLLTHDSGPMGSAKMLDLLFVAIPNEWLVPPESTGDEKKINRLESELARFKKAEPEFHIFCVDVVGSGVDKLEFEHIFYEALTDDEVSELIGSLKNRFPLATDFGSREPAERKSREGTVHILGMKEVYEPVSDEKFPNTLKRNIRNGLRNMNNYWS